MDFVLPFFSKFFKQLMYVRLNDVYMFVCAMSTFWTYLINALYEFYKQ